MWLHASIYANVNKEITCKRALHAVKRQKAMLELDIVFWRLD